MNPALYRLPLHQMISGFGVQDADGKWVAGFDTREQAADFISEMNKHAPRQPTRPKELWALWHETNEKFCRSAEPGTPILIFESEEAARIKTHSMWTAIRFDSLPIEGGP